MFGPHVERASITMAGRDRQRRAPSRHRHGGEHHGVDRRPIAGASRHHHDRRQDGRHGGRMSVDRHRASTCLDLDQ